MNPLDQLRDIHPPMAPGWWPPAPGWWVLAALLPGLAALAVHIYLRRRRANAYRPAALTALDGLMESTDLRLTGILQLMRQTALSAVPGSPLGTLPGAELLLKLDQFSGGQLATALELDGPLHSETVARWIYSGKSTPLATSQRRALHHWLGRWIRKHRREDLW